MTLSQDDLKTHTTATCSALYPGSEDTLLLNSDPSPINARTAACLSLLRSYRQDLESSSSSLPKLSQYPLKIVSKNNFPTAAGLASSAAGFAALVHAVASLYALDLSPKDLSIIARQGSGSACRSLFGGYVAWRGGSPSCPDGSDSFAEQVAGAPHWPQMRALILVVSAEKKDVPSTTGMQATVATSSLFQQRVQEVDGKRMSAMEEAIQSRNFENFAELTMRDSNSFHACCLDTYPPITYLNDVSRAAIRAVEQVNAWARKTVAAYTFDAGPNAVIYYLEDDDSVYRILNSALGGKVEGWKSHSDIGHGEDVLDLRTVKALREGVGWVICTGVGEGPQVVNEHLVREDGSNAE